MNKTLMMLLLICFPLATGCQKFMKQVMTGHKSERASAPQVTGAPHSIAFLGWGQSNMLGTVDPHGEPWAAWPPMEQLHIYDEYMIAYGEPSRGYRRGPMYHMAKAYLQKYPAATVYIINCSDSGSKIDDWTPGAEFFNRCTSFVTAMLPQGVPIGAQIVIQGETEGVGDASPVNWASRFTSTIQAFQNRYNIPVCLFGQLGAGPIIAPNWQDIKSQQVFIQAEDRLMVKTDDLPTIDGVHYSVSSIQVLGARFYSVYQGWLLD